MILSRKAYELLVGLRARLEDEEGQALVEYALILALIAVVSIVVLQLTAGSDRAGRGSGARGIRADSGSHRGRFDRRPAADGTQRLAGLRKRQQPPVGGRYVTRKRELSKGRRRSLSTGHWAFAAARV